MLNGPIGHMFAPVPDVVDDKGKQFMQGKGFILRVLLCGNRVTRKWHRLPISVAFGLIVLIFQANLVSRLEYECLTLTKRIPHIHYFFGHHFCAIITKPLIHALLA